MEDEHTNHNQEGIHYSNPWIKRIAIGTALVTGSIILAPYILPMLGLGDSALAEEAMTAMHGTGIGKGLAGSINGLVNSIPVVGTSLARGGLLTAGLSGVIGIGGVLLGHYLENKQGDNKGIRWGKVISAAALTTSALISLPSLLTSISVGIIYMCAAFSGTQMASSAVALLSKTIGSVGSMSATTTGITGAVASLPHLLSCCAPVLPAAISFGISGGHRQESPQEDPAKQFVRQLNSDQLSRINRKYSDGSIVAIVEPDGPMVINTPCKARLKLFHKDTGKPLTFDELAIVHTRKIHLFMVDQSLKDYQHIHPQPTKEAGIFSFTFTPHTPENYHAWTEFRLQNSCKDHRLKSSIASVFGGTIPPRVTVNTSARQDNMSFHWKSDSPIQQGISSIVEVNVSDSNGKPVTDLEPVMGAFAHLVGFSPDGQSMIHSHPMGTEPTNSNQRGGPRLQFHVEPDNAGPTQFYLQIKRNDQDVYVPFGQQIKPPVLASDRISSPRMGMSHGYAI